MISKETYYVFCIEGNKRRLYITAKTGSYGFGQILHEGHKFTNLKIGLEIAKNLKKINKRFDKGYKLGYVKIVKTYDFRKVEDYT